MGPIKSSEQVSVFCVKCWSWFRREQIFRLEKLEPSTTNNSLIIKMAADFSVDRLIDESLQLHICGSNSRIISCSVSMNPVFQFHYPFICRRFPRFNNSVFVKCQKTEKTIVCFSFTNWSVEIFSFCFRFSSQKKKTKNKSEMLESFWLFCS